jgi:hypothetical protein
MIKNKSLTLVSLTDWQGYVRNIQMALFGTLVLLAGVQWGRLLNGVAFLKSYSGRGFFQLFIASVTVADISSASATYKIITAMLVIIGIVNIVIGALYRRPVIPVKDVVEAKAENGNDANHGDIT